MSRRSSANLLTYALFACAAAAWLFVIAGAGAPRGQQRLSGLRATLSAASLVDVRTEQPAQVAWGRDLTLVVVLSAADCSPCLAETPQWELLADEHSPHVTILGVVVRSTEAEAKAYAEVFGARFQLLFDRQNRLATDLNIGETPVKVLLDSSGRVLSVRGPFDTVTSLRTDLARHRH